MTTAKAMNALKGLALSLVGVAMVAVLWAVVSATIAPDLPSPAKTWTESKTYILQPWDKRGEMDQGIGRMTAYSLYRVGKGFFLAILLGTPLGLLLGASKLLSQM